VSAAAADVRSALEAEGIRVVDKPSDWDLEQYNLDRAGVARLRGRFAAWPR